jgi:glycosyltransferase involved in cell wall biosynthesis
MNIIIVTPVYDDWQSLSRLMEDVSIHLQGMEKVNIVRVVVVNDGSSEPAGIVLASSRFPMTILNLGINVGHQRAIAVGLSYVRDQLKDFDAAVVMDSDGEDNPKNIGELCQKAEEHSLNKIIFAERTKRSEPFQFKLLYRIYKLIFRLLTGKSISFGNFCCIPRSLLERLVTIPDLWNHFSGSVIKSKLPYDKIPTVRSRRYFGGSKMSLENLVIHGLSSISIYLESVTIKLLVVSILGIVMVALLVVAIILVRLLTDLAIPGWASSVSLALINVGGILFIITLLLLLMQLNQRGNIQPPISSFYKNLIVSKDEFN